MADKELLTMKRLASKDGVAALGVIAARQLMDYGVSSLFLNQDDCVEIAGPGEFSLDALPEEMAITQLAAHCVPDSEIEQYLRGRDIRLKRKLEREKSGG